MSIPNEETWAVQVEYTFKGVYNIKVATKEEARQIVEQHCGLTMGDMQCTLPADRVTWHFAMIPAWGIIFCEPLQSLPHCYAPHRNPTS
jgi:hypothetical protein